MNARRYLLASIRFHARRHAGVLLGTALAAAVLTGALAVGDSVRGSLLRLVRLRLGRTVHGLVAGDRFVRSALAGELAAAGVPGVVPVLSVDGVASAPDRGRRAGAVAVVGIDARFAGVVGEEAAFPFPAAGEVVLNRPLAARLDAAAGDAILLRVRRADALSAEAPLAAEPAATPAMRLRVRGIVDDDRGGRFDLRARQAASPTAFVELGALGAAIGREGRANLLLATGAPPSVPPPDRLDAALAAAWRPADAGIRVRTLAGGARELVSDRFFLDTPAARAALDAVPGATPVFAYFAEELEAGGRVSPFAFVAAPGAPLCPPDLPDDAVVLNAWAAEDLGAAPGDRLRMTYFLPAGMGRLERATNTFRVARIAPMAGDAADPALVPPLPGFSDAERCSDWKPGLPIDLDRVRPADEAYWAAYRTAPRAFVTLEAAQAMWAGRFGSLTSVRFPAPAAPARELEARILSRLRPSDLGFAFRPLLREGRLAGAGGVDFGQLFLGLSFFLIAAAVALTGMLFAFGIEQRAEEAGLLLALGFTPGRVRRWWMAEGAVVAALGAVPGAAVGLAYNRLVLRALAGAWRGAVGTTALAPHVRPATLATGAAAGLAAALAAMAWAARRAALRPLNDVRAAGGPGMRPARASRARVLAAVGATTAAAGAVPAVLAQASRGAAAAGIFFGAGALLLGGGLLLARALLEREACRVRPAGAPLPARALGVRQLTRRPGRALGAGAMLASGVFLVAAVGANRAGPAGDPRDPGSGTGGYALAGPLALPLVDDLNTPAGRLRFGLDTAVLEGVRFTALRLRDGDDASCLNLNRVSRPPLLGVPAARLDRRGAFGFAAFAGGADRARPWRTLLAAPAGPAGGVPGFADQAVITWGLGLAPGEAVRYEDEAGRAFRVRLAAGLRPSILQGYVLIDEAELLRRFPSTEGARFLLVDTPAGRERAVRDELLRGLADLGPGLALSTDRLASFATVQNTYLSVFLALGGLGLAVGALGWSVVVLRNVDERRGELALLRALGFTRPRLLRALLAEHGALLGGALLLGAAAAAVALLPALRTRPADVPWRSLAAAGAAIAAAAGCASAAAGLLVMRRRAVADLRDE